MSLSDWDSKSSKWDSKSSIWFDEAANIRLATKLQEAGAKVAYGVVGRKCHAKMLLIVRREGKNLKRYVHLATGNYHTGTSRLYTDFSLLSADPKIGEDVHNMFMHMESLLKILILVRMQREPRREVTRLLRTAF